MPPYIGIAGLESCLVTTSYNDNDSLKNISWAKKKVFDEEENQDHVLARYLGHHH